MLRGELTHLIEEDRAAIGGFDAAGLVGERAGEGAAHVTEQLGLDEIRGDGAAVDGDEGAAAAAAVVMDGARDEFLAGARLAEDEHRGIALATRAA